MVWLTDRFGGLSLPRKSVVRLTDRPDKTLDVYRGNNTITTLKEPSKIAADDSFIFFTFIFQIK